MEKVKKKSTAEDELWDSLNGDTKKEEPSTFSLCLEVFFMISYFAVSCCILLEEANGSALKTAQEEATKKVAALKIKGKILAHKLQIFTKFSIWRPNRANFRYQLPNYTNTHIS